LRTSGGARVVLDDSEDVLILLAAVGAGELVVAVGGRH
jgi:hypothetical protein